MLNYILSRAIIGSFRKLLYISLFCLIRLLAATKMGILSYACLVSVGVSDSVSESYMLNKYFGLTDCVKEDLSYVNKFHMSLKVKKDGWVVVVMIVETIHYLLLINFIIIIPTQDLWMLLAGFPLHRC